MKKKYFRYAVGILITALALGLSFRNFDWGTLKNSISQVKPGWVLLALVNILCSVYIMGWRWQILLKSKSHIPLSDMFRFNIISQYVNIVIPARFGEFLKAWLVARKYSLSGSYVLGTILIEKITEAFIIISLALLAPLIFTFQTSLKGHTIVMVILLASIPFMILVIWKRERVRRWIARLAAILPDKPRIRILNFLDKGMEAFALLKNIKMILLVVFTTFLIIFSQVITNWILFKAYGFQLSIFEAIILQLILLIGMSLPSVPGKLGVFEYTVILALSMFGIKGPIAFSYGLMLHLIAYVPKILLGLLFTANLPISLKKAETEIRLDTLPADTGKKTNPGPDRDGKP
jgi:glycosyltransferase 2 family protein